MMADGTADPKLLEINKKNNLNMNVWGQKDTYSPDELTPERKLRFD
jgi:hypothetical protein